MSPLLNYTTQVPVQRTIGEVHALLVEAGARQIITTYSDVGTPTGVAFGIVTAHGTRGFKLPVQTHRVLRVMQLDKKTPPRFKTPEQAERVGWRIVKDWLEAQLAIVRTEMVTFDEVMLPYMRGAGDRTVYELYMEDQLPALTGGDEFE